MRTTTILIVAAVAGLLEGCYDQSYSSETTLHPNGSVDRTIRQPLQYTPESVQKQQLWVNMQSDQTYFSAEGAFESVDVIPDYYVRESLDETKAARLERHYSQTDHVFVTEHIWEEMLTDVVTLEDMTRGRRELESLFISLAHDVLRELLGPEYEVSRVIEWMETEGRTWFEELTDLFIDLSARKPPDQDEEWNRRCNEIFARHGAERTEDCLSADDALNEFARRKLPELIRRRDGKPLDEAALDSIMFWLSSEDKPLEQVYHQIIAREHGGKKAFKKRVGTLYSRIFGAHLNIFSQADVFRYSLVVPGKLVESNGVLLGDSEVSWRFRGEEAYPFGYRMVCRSLEPNLDRQGKLLAGQPLINRQTMLRYLALVEECKGSNDGCGGLYKALLESSRRGDITPLLEGRKEEKFLSEQVELLWKLLKLPE